VDLSVRLSSYIVLPEYGLSMFSIHVSGYHLIFFSVLQGVVYWQPPVRALEKVKEVIWEPSVGHYGADEGLPELKEALMQKVWFISWITLVLWFASYRLGSGTNNGVA